MTSHILFHIWFVLCITKLDYNLKKEHTFPEKGFNRLGCNFRTRIVWAGCIFVLLVIKGSHFDAVRSPSWSCAQKEYEYHSVIITNCRKKRSCDVAKPNERLAITQTYCSPRLGCHYFFCKHSKHSFYFYSVFVASLVSVMKLKLDFLPNKLLSCWVRNIK